MSMQNLITDIVILLFPILLVLALFAFRLIEQRLPEKQRAALDQFVKYAVHFVEQTSTGTSAQKKNMAVSLIYDFFSAMRLPLPPHILVDAALEACCFELNQSKIPDEFTTGKAINTGPIKPVLPPTDPGGTPA